MSPQPRRFTAEHDTPVVMPLHEVIDGKIAASHGVLEGKLAAAHVELTGEISHLREDVKRLADTQTSEHREVRDSIVAVKTEFRNGFAKADLAIGEVHDALRNVAAKVEAQETSERVRLSTLQKTGAATAFVAAIVLPTLSLILNHS